MSLDRARRRYEDDDGTRRDETDETPCPQCWRPSTDGDYCARCYDEQDHVMAHAPDEDDREVWL